MDIQQIIKDLTLEEKAGLVSGADFWTTRAVERLGLPSVMMTDGPHGLRKQVGEGDHMGINKSHPAVCFPPACALASSFDPDLAYLVGETIAEECRREGIGMLLGPGVNIKRSPLCGRNFEYFSEDPFLAGRMAAAFVKGLQDKGAVACVKHYAANNQENERMTSDSRMDERTLHEIYLAAFEHIVKDARPGSVMCSYNRINGTYLAENRHMLTEVLRDKWGFDGFVVTDWFAVKDRVKGLLAGLDLEMPGGKETNTRKIIKAVKEGALDEKVLDQAVSNLLAFVSKANPKGRQMPLDFEGDYKIAVKAAKKSAVLLKNEGNILPLKKGEKIAFIGEFAKAPRYQGSGSSFINSQKLSNALEAAGDKVKFAQGYVAEAEKGDEGLLREALELAGESKAAVIFAGLPNSFESEGYDRTSLDLPQNQNELIEAVCAVQPNTVVVLHNGSPVAMPWLDKVKAVLEMYLGGDGVGEAAASLLFGDSNPSGKLPESFIKRIEDSSSYPFYPGKNGVADYAEGILVGYRYYDKKDMEVLFPFGHGLSYTTFAYSDLKLSASDLSDRETLTLTFKVKNTGEYEGAEAVQVYVEPVNSRVLRPKHELKAFKKVSLLPGEEKELAITLDKMAFAYYEPAVQDWFVESGEYKIHVGASSRDFRLKGSVKLTGTVKIPVHFDRYSMVGDVMADEKGRQLAANMMSQFDLSSVLPSDGQDEGLGGGFQKMMESMMMAMPLDFLVTFGLITDEQLEGFLMLLNG